MDLLIALAKLGVFAFALWLIVAAVIMALWPQQCLAFLRKMGSTPAIHFGEHILRGLAGACLIGIAVQTPYPKAFMIVGGFILATSIIIGLAPRRWHHRYAVYWADKVSSLALRLMAPVPLAVGLYLMWLLLTLQTCPQRLLLGHANGVETTVYVMGFACAG